MLWSDNKWKPGAALDAATAAYLEKRRNEKVVQIVFKLKGEYEEMQVFCNDNSADPSGKLVNALAEKYSTMSLANDSCADHRYMLQDASLGDNDGTNKYQMNNSESYLLNPKDDNGPTMNYQKLSRESYLLNPKDDNGPTMNYQKLSRDALKRGPKNPFVSYLKYTEPSVFNGKFAVPIKAVTGNEEVDGLNTALAGNYTKVSALLKEWADLIAVLGLDSTSGVNFKKIGAVRTFCFVLRRHVKTLGGVPLAEPICYWRFMFSSVPF